MKPVSLKKWSSSFAPGIAHAEGPRVSQICAGHRSCAYISLMRAQREECVAGEVTAAGEQNGDDIETELPTFRALKALIWSSFQRAAR